MTTAVVPAPFSSPETLSLNERAYVLVDAIARDADLLRCRALRGTCGERLIDMGASVAGSLEAGRRLAEVCVSGLANVRLAPVPGLDFWPLGVSLHFANAALACLGSQYAGWRLYDEKSGYFALGSGPARAQARIETLFDHFAHRESGRNCVLVTESAVPPPAAVIRYVAQACKREPRDLSILYAPTNSIAASVQVAARVVEVAFHRALELNFPLDQIVDAYGSAPIAPVARDSLSAMGRVNDAIIYGGLIHLHVACSDEAAEHLARNISSDSSMSYGKTFVAMLSAAGGDFYAIDKGIFSPAKVFVSNCETGRTFMSGGFNVPLLKASFGL